MAAVVRGEVMVAAVKVGAVREVEETAAGKGVVKVAETVAARVVVV
jgi:hypothetical protein